MGSETGVDQRQKRQYLRLILVAGVVVLLDQLSKAVIWETMPLYHSVTVIPGFFDLTHVHNPGGAFGFFARQSEGLRQFIFIVLTVVAIVAIFFFYRRVAIFFFYRRIPPSHSWLAVGLPWGWP